MLQTLSILLAALLWATAAGAADDAATERSRIETEIQHSSAAFAAEDAACRQRFVVTSCVEEVQLRRRETLGLLRSRLLALDDAERQQRASARLAAIEGKRQAQRSSVPQPPQPRPLLDRAPREIASAPLIVLRRDQAAADRQQAASAAAAQRVLAAKRRQQQAGEDAARVDEKLRERERGGKNAASLPVPVRAVPETPR